MPPPDRSASALSAPRRGRGSLMSGHRKVEPPHQAARGLQALVELAGRAGVEDLRERIVPEGLGKRGIDARDRRVIVASPHLVEPLLGFRPIDEYRFRRLHRTEEQLARPEAE